ncbi:MAG: sulfurtransferase TusA family protein [Deltaproteobacteria bacterium]|nr:sulfurtransferase TusA family protein [Deltaproteobacteria bacterium]
MMDVKPDLTLDVRGLSCPMPLLKTKKAIQELKKGQIIEVFSSDPGTKNDIPAFAKRANHDFLGFEEAEGYTKLYLRV